MGKLKHVIMELTYAELDVRSDELARALRRGERVSTLTGKLESVPNDPRLVKVPEEFVEAARGVEDKGDLSVATATFNRGTGHAEAAAQANADADKSGTDAQTGVPREDSTP